MTFLEILFILIIFVLFYIIYIQYHKTEKLIQLVSNQQDIQEDVLKRMENTIEELRQIDLRGSFESDDEVGFTWKNIKEIIDVLSVDVVNAFNITEIGENTGGKKKEK